MSNIINPFTKPEAQKPKVLDLEIMGQIAGALGRFRELSALEVQTPAHAAEITGNVQYLSQIFLDYGEQLLGAWFTVRQEYQPLIQAFSTLAFRVNGVLNAKRAPGQQAVKVPADGETAENEKAQ